MWKWLIQKLKKKTASMHSSFSVHGAGSAIACTRKAFSIQLRIQGFAIRLTHRAQKRFSCIRCLFSCSLATSDWRTRENWNNITTNIWQHLFLFSVLNYPAFGEHPSAKEHRMTAVAVKGSAWWAWHGHDLIASSLPFQLLINMWHLKKKKNILWLWQSYQKLQKTTTLLPFNINMRCKRLEFVDHLIFMRSIASGDQKCISKPRGGDGQILRYIKELNQLWHLNIALIGSINSLVSGIVIPTLIGNPL